MMSGVQSCRQAVGVDGADGTREAWSVSCSVLSDGYAHVPMRTAPSERVKIHEVGEGRR